MRITCRVIEPDGGLRITDETTALASWRDGQGPFWIDLETEDTGAMVTWLTDLGLDAQLIASYRVSDSTGRVLALDESVFFEYPVPPPAGGSAAIIFACLCLDRLLITMHHQPVVAEHRELLAAKVRLRDSSTSDLVCALAIAQSLSLRRAALSLRDRTRDMSAAMDDEPESVPLADILALKRQLLDLDRMADEQMAVFDSLGVIDKPQLNLVGIGDFFHTAVANVQAAARRLERLDRFVLGLQHRYENLQQERINRRLGVLTILSAVFMPLTLIAGIYGMNFDVMPELHFPYAYPVTLGGMAVVAVALFWYFRSRGWLE